MKAEMKTWFPSLLKKESPVLNNKESTLSQAGDFKHLPGCCGFFLKAVVAHLATTTRAPAGCLLAALQQNNNCRGHMHGGRGGGWRHSAKQQE